MRLYISCGLFNLEVEFDTMITIALIQLLA